MKQQQTQQQHDNNDYKSKDNDTIIYIDQKT